MEIVSTRHSDCMFTGKLSVLCVYTNIHIIAGVLYSQSYRGVGMVKRSEF